MTSPPLRVAALGMGWWSDVLADAAKRSGAIEIVACFTRSPDKRHAFAAKYGCKAAASYEDILADASIEAIVNTTPNSVHLETTRMAAAAGKHVFLDKPIANTVAEGAEIARICERGRGRARARLSAPAREPFPLDQARDRRRPLRQAGAGRRQYQPRPARPVRPPSWRYQAAGMPGGVMLQIGIHYVDVLEMLLGPVERVSGMSAQLVLPGDNPDVANLILEHDSGAISNLTASYASASEYYMMNVYGKEASAYYDLFSGLRHLKRGETKAQPVATEKNDTIREELEEFAHCVRTGAKPETDGFWATRNLAVIKAGVRSAREGRAVDVADVINERRIGRERRNAHGSTSAS